MVEGGERMETENVAANGVDVDHECLCRDRDESYRHGAHNVTRDR